MIKNMVALTTMKASIEKIHAVVLFFSEFDKRILLYEAKEMGIRAN